MKKFIGVVLLLVVSACTAEPEKVVWEQPDYNHIAAHTRVVSKTANYVTYEYKDIRVDEIAPIAALYCQDHGGKQAVLYDVLMRPDHSRRATFMCKKMTDF